LKAGEKGSFCEINYSEGKKQGKLILARWGEMTAGGGGLLGFHTQWNSEMSGRGEKCPNAAEN